MANSTIQPSFTSGEIAPSLWGRVDISRYYTGLKTCKNFIVRQFGGVSNRPGTKYVGDSINHNVVHRLIPFQFSTEQTYALVFGDQKFRIIKDGGLVVYPVGHPDEGNIVEITTPFLEADLFDLVYSQSADVLTVSNTKYPSQQITRTDHHLWTVAAYESTNGPFQDINIDSAKTVISSGVSGVVTITSVADIFTADMVGELFYIEQSASSIANIKRWEVGKAVTVNDIRKAGSAYYQAVTSGTTGTVRPSTLEGVESDGDPGVTWNYLHSGFGIVKITGFTSTKIVIGTVQSRLPDSIVTATSAKTITNAIGFDPDLSPATGDEYIHITCNTHGFITGDSVTIAGVAGMTSINGVRQVTVIDANTFRIDIEANAAYVSGGTATKTLTATATYKWAKAAYGVAQGYPAANSYYQQRKLFGGSTNEPQKWRASKTAGYIDFGTSVPILDDDAITHEIAAREVNAIQHFVELNSLVILTTNGPWIVKGGTNDVITPAAVSVKRQRGSSGASKVTPLVIGTQAIYVQSKGNQVRSLGYNFANDAFDGADLTMYSNHLFKGRQVIDWCYQQVPFSCVWVVLDNGVLLGLTFMPEQEVIGWHQHNTDGFYESVCSISEGNEDAVYTIVRRTIGGVTKRYIERLASRTFDTISDAIFLDSCLSYDGRQSGTITITGGVSWVDETCTATSSTAVFVAGDVGNEIHLVDSLNKVYRLRITAFTSSTVVSVLLLSTLAVEFRAVASTWGLAKDVFAGLGHLEGKAVKALADGRVVTDLTVTGGSVALDYASVVVHVGLSYNCDIETLSLNVSGSNLLDKNKNIARVKVMCDESVGLMAGPDASHLDLYKQRSLENYDQAIQPETAIADILITSTWGTGGNVFIRQSNPLPLTVLAIMPEVNIAS